MRDSFIFYRSFYECVLELPEKERLQMYDAIAAFALNDEEPGFTGILSALFKAIKPQILANAKKYENGCKGGRPKNQTETKAKPNNNQKKPNNNLTITKPKPNETKTKPSVNDNVNDNENDNDNGSGFDERNTDVVPALLSFLNSETGGSFTETEQFDDLVTDLFERGYTVDDIKTVIRRKAMEWSCDGKMRSLLRPSVLLGDKFEEYLNAPEPIEVEEQRSKSERPNSFGRISNRNPTS